MIKPGGGQSSQTRSMMTVLPSIISGALPCFITPPVQNDLAVKDTADRRRNLKPTWEKTNKQTKPELTWRPRSPVTFTDISPSSNYKHPKGIWSVFNPALLLHREQLSKRTDRQTQSHCCFTWNFNFCSSAALFTNHLLQLVPSLTLEESNQAVHPSTF